MTQNNDKIKDRIRKLLNLANDEGAMGGEIDNALRFARRLMLEHNIEEGDLKSTPSDPHEIAANTEYAQSEAYTTGARFATWEVWLAQAISKLLGTVGSYRDAAGGVQIAKTAHGTIEYDTKGNPRRACRMRFYGPAEDARDAVELFREWSLIIASMARMKYGGALKGDGLDYANGFALGIFRKVEAIRSEEHATLGAPTGKDLVLVRATDVMAAKREAGESFLKSEGVKLQKGAARQVRTGGAYRAGMEDGKRAEFRRERVRKLGAA